MSERGAEKDAGPTSKQVVKMFDLHDDVHRAERRLDDAFPPWTGEQFAVIRDKAETLRQRAEELRDHLDQMRVTPPASSAQPDEPGKAGEGR
jgi:hypothetical protein